MPAMMDATCPQCRRRFGWSGEVTDRPPCPRCGHQLPRAELTAGAAKVAEVRRLLFTHPRDADGPADLKAMRVLAGLTLGQAAKLLGVKRDFLDAVERGLLPAPGMGLADRMAEIYGCGD